MKFEEWFIAQHGPRSNSHLKEFADERLADWIKQGQDAERELRDRGTWDLQFTAALRAWHHRYGLPERFSEIKDALMDAGVLNNETGNLPIRAIAKLVEQRDALRSRLAEAERNEETLLGMIRHQRDVLRECLPYINESMAGRRPGRCADDIRAAVKALTADSASVVQYKPCEICTTQSWCETHGCQCYPVSAVQPERCCLDYPRCDCNSPPEPDNAPALQPCGHPWKAQHDFKCILCSSPG